MPQTQQKPDDWSGDQSNPDWENKARENERNASQNGSHERPAPKETGNNRVEHEAIGDGTNPLSESGKDIGLVHAPIVSLNPTSGNKGEKPKKDFEVFDKANHFLNHTGPRHDFAYPFLDMDIGQGFFVPVEQNSNIDKLIAHLHRSVVAFQKQTSVEEKDENGDDVMESVTVLPKKRTQDGIIQLDGLGKPIVGANHTNRPKLIHMAQFVIKAATKDDEIAEGRKAESDGALVIRVA